MILGPVSYLDCIIFCIFLAPQLLIYVGPVETIRVVLQCLPFLLYELPYSFVHERYFVKPECKSPFVQIASPFEDCVIRCVRYAFANIPPKVGRVFFSKAVSLPFLRFRMLRHGYLISPVHWHEFRDRQFQGIWLLKDPMNKPDICIFYVHGGGFSMGSSYFYMEFLLTWISMLSDSGYRNPAMFALEYTIVPDTSFPTQLQEAVAAYCHVLSTMGDSAKVCLSGDSAGACIVLSLLLHLAKLDFNAGKINGVAPWHLAQPEMVLLISPWVKLLSEKYQNTASDYLDGKSLQRYARMYAGDESAVDDPVISPGNCEDVGWWKKACPPGGIFIAYGAEEVLAPEISDFIGFLDENNVKVRSWEERAGIHAWPVASLFLSTSPRDRQKGLRNLVREIRETISPG